MSACTASAVPCAGVGVDSGVSVTFLRDGYGDLTGASYELCARGECVERALPPGRVTRLRLTLPLDVDPARGPVRLRVTPWQSDDPVIDASTEVELMWQSDGCGGGAYNHTGLAFTKDDGLLTKVPERVMEAWRADLEGSPPASPSTPTPTPTP
ncbi:hypothetical protein GCM10017771_57920 [Streptomyces capitiformicae]|uniref:Uncharacterized protein n=1 Tax=Streptomyces capitiformicae TaxID=2014920 RepID=A0A918Z7J2_9ACTN|nr:hypothetical protein GCM10017771_57920 [Streptomyces capitiformicae]